MITIIYKCDLCNKNTTNLKSIILHKKQFDYCPNCEQKAKQIKEKFEKEMKIEYLWYERNLKRIEQKIYDEEIKSK